MAKLLSDLGPESWVQIHLHDLPFQFTSPDLSSLHVQDHPLSLRGGSCCQRLAKYHSCYGGCWQIIVSLLCVCVCVCVQGDPARRSSSGSDSFAHEEGEVRNPQTQTSLGWKPFAAKAYRNILVFYKPLAPSTRAGRLIRLEGLADLLLTALGFCLSLCPAAVCPQAVRHQPRKGYSWLRMILPKHPTQEPRPWASLCLGRALTAEEQQGGL